MVYEPTSCRIFTVALKKQGLTWGYTFNPNPVMKTFACIILLFAATGFAAAQSTAADEAAIKETLKNETKALFARDYAAWAPHWVQDPHATMLGVGPTYLLRGAGWEEISKMVKDFIAANPAPDVRQVTTKDYVFDISGNVAWVRYTQQWTSGAESGTTYEHRTLKKVNGAWKLVAMIAVEAGPYGN